MIYEYSKMEKSEVDTKNNKQITMNDIFGISNSLTLVQTTKGK